MSTDLPTDLVYGEGRRTDWHRLFFFVVHPILAGTKWEVPSETGLSRQQQFFNGVVRERGDIPPEAMLLEPPWPIGLRPEAPHSLFTFKSPAETLDSGALCELLGHWVNYTKRGQDWHVSP